MEKKSLRGKHVQCLGKELLRSIWWMEECQIPQSACKNLHCPIVRFPIHIRLSHEIQFCIGWPGGEPEVQLDSFLGFFSELNRPCLAFYNKTNLHSVANSVSASFTNIFSTSIKVGDEQEGQILMSVPSLVNYNQFIPLYRLNPLC